MCFRQIAVADLTIINKTDLVNEEELTQIRDAVRSVSHTSTLFYILLISFIFCNKTITKCLIYSNLAIYFVFYAPSDTNKKKENQIITINVLNMYTVVHPNRCSYIHIKRGEELPLYICLFFCQCEKCHKCIDNLISHPLIPVSFVF